MLTHDANSRELVMRHQGLVRAIASSLVVSLPPKTEFEDLLSYGQIGLAEAASEYDPELGIKFSTFAYYRIRGAILDGAYQMSWYKRSYARKLKQQRLAADILKSQRESPSDLDELSDTASSVVRLMVVGLAVDAADSTGQFEDQIADPAAQSPDDQACDKEAIRLLRNAVAALPNDERELIESAYFHGETLVSIAKRNGRNKWWASRLHEKAINRLSDSLRSIGLDD